MICQVRLPLFVAFLKRLVAIRRLERLSGDKALTDFVRLKETRDGKFFLGVKLRAKLNTPGSRLLRRIDLESGKGPDSLYAAGRRYAICGGAMW